MSKTARPYRCPGCDREAKVFITRTTLHRFGNNGLSYSISCSDDGKPDNRNECLGIWFSWRPFESEINAVSAWNDAIIDMASSALGITRKDALAIKEKRARIAEIDHP